MSETATRVGVGRRNFLVTSASLILGLTLAGKNAAAGGSPLTIVRGGDASPDLFIELRPDETVAITCHRSEMGQQIWTAMAQIIAEELEADWDRVRIVQAVGHPRYGDQNTDGSRSVRYNFHRLRVAGGALRTMLERAAAKRWKVAPSSCRAVLGKVTHPATKRSLSYGELAADARAQPIPAEGEIVLKKRADWRYIAKPVKSLTVPRIVRGEGTFGMDVQLPNMLVAVIARPPQVFGKLKSVDDSQTKQVSGVVETVTLDTPKPPAHFQPLGGVAVVARNTWAAIQGREMLELKWEEGPSANYDSETFAQELMAKVRKPGEVRRRRGDVAAALERAAETVAAEYYVPHLVHSPIEPPVATAKWDGDEVTCWACVQAPQAARKAVARACEIPEDNVTINVTWLGGGFGRKSKPDFVAEAALVARAVQAPVKLVWTREDELKHGYYHAVSAQRLEAGLDSEGRCVAFLHRTAFPVIGSTFEAGADQPSWGELRLGASDTPFAVPNLQLETGRADAHLRIGWLRSVANIYHAFAVQSFVAELAHAAGRDPKDYLLELIGPPRHVDPNDEGAEYDNYGSSIVEHPIDTARLAAVTTTAATMADWGRPLPKGHGLGIAAHRSFAAYVATVVEVAVDEAGRLTIVGVWSAMDAGTVVNTNHAHSQLEGGTLFGLSNALYGQITAKQGIVEQQNFPAWRVMRMNEAPRHMETTIIASDAPPGGVGEPPTPPAAPALTNAIFAACGLRVRRLPIFGPDRRDRLAVEGAKQ
ncbi:Membrane-bound aldehyde dehydrogenase [pyrroloquinoline-quinone] precursor [Enhygromyxa salina]|uniref:Membrane-bound aldehyde dehydrogenase [pyrroloquinoline-quinone] n=1 Tax=Enhygromyxa salina TaxID=215803 RepID=A0A2S9XBF1_9BACT|nr:molybdopterin cofactor-binding domain-containing protein [Enhygromyxa salina]PRP90184.1 Membrane-bound aldehyde dehydrogenase [pyrroloquinoline-quinone] precursor [Enhygromyxa salina]